MTPHPDRHYVNLTDGLEWAADLPPGYRFVRVESTAVERGETDRVVRDLDSDLLMHLALGYRCFLYDCGTRRPTSKTVSVAVPFIVRYLTRLWLSTETRTRSAPVPARTPEARAAKRKAGYFRRFVDTDEVRLVGVSRRTDRDGDVAFYRALALAARGPA